MLTKPRKILLLIAALFYSLAGVLHFLKPAPYLKIMPPYLPWPLAMVYVSGAAEIAGGLGLLIPPVRRAAAWGLVALLIAVFPANVYMATNRVEAGAAALSPAVLYGRLLLQPLLIWWVLWCTKPAARAV
ncbi:MAG: DoxX family protein [Bryobacteraceae bacterium]